jgi:hypothetical protein
MRTQHLPLVLAALFAGCIRPASAPPAPAGGDRTIVFPQFFEHAAITVGASGGTYELDGEILRAVAIAANDFLPPHDPPGPCHKRQEAQIYRVIRQGNVIFVDIRENHEYCGHRYPALDSGAKYAVSTDGRILRYVLDGAEGGPFDTGTSPGEVRGEEFTGELGSSPAFDALWNAPLSSPAAEPQDGGIPSSDSGPSPSAPTSHDGGCCTW